MIEFQKVTATYKKDVGVFDISFQVDAGEMVFLMGPTGAGKSTVLKAIYRGMQIDTGKIIIDGEEISTLNKHKIPKITVIELIPIFVSIATRIITGF